MTPSANRYTWFKHVSSASKSLEAAHDYIVGGELTSTLEAIGDAHLASAIDHIYQSRTSANPRERVFQAAGELQTAYFLYEASTKRGIAALRPFVNFRQLADIRAKAAGTAATVALSHWYVDETPPNIQVWLLRTKDQLYAHDRELYAIRAVRSYPEHVGAELSEVARSYFQLEANLLPIDLRSRLPDTLVPIDELIQSGWKQSELTRQAIERRWGKYPRPEARWELNRFGKRSRP